MSYLGRSAFRHLRLVAVAATMVCGASFALAQLSPTGKPFDLTVNVNGTYNPATDVISGGIQAPVVGLATVADLFDLSKSNGLSSVNPNYNDNSASVIRFGYRGLPIVLQTAANSPVITLLIPGLNETVVFSAQATRDGNVNDVTNYLKKSGGDILNRLQQLLAKASPIDPVAGNPGSMQTRMVNDDFDRNFTQFASNIKSDAGVGGEQVNNLIGVGLTYGNFTQAGVTNKVITIPVSYTMRPDLDPRRQLTIYAPITVSDVAGAKSYSANLGLAYRVPINDEWALTPAVGYGISGSVDLGSVAAMLAASLTSQYTIRMSGYDLAIGNMLGLYQSNKFSAGGYSFDPKIHNTVMRNGLMVSIPTHLLGQKMSFEVSYINTQYSGTDLYSKQYNELGLTLGTNKGANSARSYLRGGLNYVQGQNGIRGTRVNVGYWF